MGYLGHDSFHWGHGPWPGCGQGQRSHCLGSTAQRVGSLVYTHRTFPTEVSSQDKPSVTSTWWSVIHLHLILMSVSTLSSWLSRLQGSSFFNTFPICGIWPYFLLPHHPAQYWPPPPFSAHFNFNLVTSAKIFFFSKLITFTGYGSWQGYLSKKYFSSLPEGLIVFKEICIFRLFPKGKFSKKLTTAEKKLLDKNETDLNQPVWIFSGLFQESR